MQFHPEQSRLLYFRMNLLNARRDDFRTLQGTKAHRLLHLEKASREEHPWHRSLYRQFPYRNPSLPCVHCFCLHSRISQAFRRHRFLRYCLPYPRRRLLELVVGDRLDPDKGSSKKFRKAAISLYQSKPSDKQMPTLMMLHPQPVPQRHRSVDPRSTAQ